MSSEVLKAVALKAGLIDPDALVFTDLTKDDGTVKGADELVAALKEAKPHLFGKRASEMTPEEAAAKLAELRKGSKPEPLPLDKTAKEMTLREWQRPLRNVQQRAGHLQIMFARSEVALRM